MSPGQVADKHVVAITTRTCSDETGLFTMEVERRFLSNVGAELTPSETVSPLGPQIMNGVLMDYFTSVGIWYRRDFSLSSWCFMLQFSEKR